MWLAVRLMHWALDYRAPSQETHALVIQTTAQRQTVMAASVSALQAGVYYGMTLADARMRMDQVHIYDRNTPAEIAALKRLAGWAWRYSNRIHWAVAGPDIECSRLVLEIGASLKLFGGRKALLAQIRNDLQAFGYRYRAGVGDSPQAALAFARVPNSRRPSPASGLSQSGIETLPITALDLPRPTIASLSASGLQYAGEILALPPATLARRYGQSTLDYLEQLRARRPHRLALYRLPTRYATRHELTGAVETTQGLVFVLRRIFLELAAFLRGADSAIQTLQMTLFHEREPATRLVLRLSAPSHDAHHFERIAQERLARLTLAAPVLELGMASDRLRRSEHAQPTFWSTTTPQTHDHWPAVLDRLRARLGHGAVSWLAAPADHRPEQATATLDHPPSDACHADGPPRPLWLLHTPKPIDSTLTWVSGPERIETGWWQTGIRRDYYRALDDSGRLLWVFRDLKTAAANNRVRYYLHGLFG